MVGVPNAWSAEQCAKLLQKARRTPNGWHACCPAHDDKNPSLFLADGKDGLAAVCYAGCSYRSIVDALEARGAHLSRRPDDVPTEHFSLGEYHQFWDYRDPQGRIIMRVCRWMQPGGRKDIRPIVRTADGWKWQHHPTPRPLFQLDRLANEPESPVLIVEGEKAAHAAQRLFPDHIVTTWPGGAQSVGQADWGPIKGRSLVLVPDNDAPGRKAMAWVAQHVKTLAASVRTVDPAQFDPQLPEGWDFADALAEGRNVSAWLEESKPQSRLKRLSELVANPSRPSWLIRDVLEQGVIAMLLGPRGTFKSFVATHWSMTIATEGMPVVMISAEGSGIERRMRAWLKVHADPKYRADLTPIYALEQRVDFNSDEATALLIQDIEALGIDPALIVIDTLSKNSGGMDENSNTEVKAFIGRLDNLLKRRWRCTVLLVHHTGHVERGRARGASALEADTDAAYVINRSPGTMDITVTRERFKDSGDLPPLAYRAEVIRLGEFDELGQDVTSLALRAVDASTVQTEKRGVPRGLRQRDLLKALKEQQAAHPDGPVWWSSIQLRQLARDLGMPKQTAQDTAANLAHFYLIPGVGGWRLRTPEEEGKL